MYGVVQANESVSETPPYGTMTMSWELTAVDARPCVDIRADDVPDGINAARRLVLPDRSLWSAARAPLSPPLVR